MRKRFLLLTVTLLALSTGCGTPNKTICTSQNTLNST